VRGSIPRARRLGAGARDVERDLRPLADRQQLLAALPLEAKPERLSLSRSDVQVQAALVG